MRRSSVVTKPETLDRRDRNLLIADDCFLAFVTSEVTLLYTSVSH